MKDVDVATMGVTGDLQEAMNGDQGPLILETARAQHICATALRKELDRLIQREMIQRPKTIISSSHIKDEPLEEDDSKLGVEESQDNVLTLLANNQPPKQLFTSLRKPGSSQPLNDASLPNGITTTRVIPQQSINANGSKSIPQFKDVFAPPPSIPPLSLPKQSRHTSTRSSSVNWYNPTETESKPKSNRRDGYIDQALSSGQWLKYSVAPSPTQLASPETKRKQRDRALSIGEPQTSLSQEAVETHNHAKEEALFRSVYSSFAPVRDNSGALVAEQQKNRLWWKKHGESRYHDLLELRDEENRNAGVGETDGILDDDTLDEEELKEAIANWKPEETSEEMQAPRIPRIEPPESTKEADELLEEISDLLETLHSHQRIRNLTLAGNTRPVAGQNPQSTSTAANSTSPSSAEFDVYDMLKDQLALIVATLPPYLLSKLDGEKMGALKISTQIQVESKDATGVLEESEGSAVAKRGAVAPPPVAPASTSQTPSAYSGMPGRSNSYLQSTTPATQYPRAGYGASTAPRPATNASYLQNPQYSNRPASTNYSSSTARASYAAGYPPQGAAPSAPRYNYAQQYGQQQSQSGYGTYQNGYRPFSGQNANNYNYNSQIPAAQSRAPSNPAPASSQAYRGAPAEYQQRAVPPQGYGYGTAQGSGSASPHTQHRPSYAAQTPQGPASQRPPLSHQHSSQHQTQGAPSPQVNGTGTSGTPTPPGHMSADEQAVLMSRQKAQVAGHQSRPGSNTPQPASRHYSPQQNGTQANGTAGPPPNGTTAGPD